LSQHALLCPAVRGLGLIQDEFGIKEWRLLSATATKDVKQSLNKKEA
jgi:hypothetical protein